MWVTMRVIFKKSPNICQSNCVVISPSVNCCSGDDCIPFNIFTNDDKEAAAASDCWEELQLWGGTTIKNRVVIPQHEFGLLMLQQAMLLHPFILSTNASTYCKLLPSSVPNVSLFSLLAFCMHFSSGQLPSSYLLQQGIFIAKSCRKCIQGWAAPTKWL